MANARRTHARPKRCWHLFGAPLRIATFAIAAIRTLSIGRANGILARRLCLLLLALATACTLIALAATTATSRRGTRRPFSALGSFIGPILACFAACLNLLRCRLLFTSLATFLLGLLSRHLRSRDSIRVDEYRVFAQFKAFGVVEIHRFAHQSFDVVELIKVLLGNKRERPANIAAAARTTNTMDIVDRIFRHIEVDDIVHIGDIDSSSQHIGCDQNINLTGAERAKSALTLVLCAIAVNNRAGDVSLHQTTTASIGTMLGASKDNNALGARLFQHLSQKRILRL